MTEEYILTMSRNTDYRNAEGEWIYEEETYEFSTWDEAYDFAMQYRTISAVKNEFTIEGGGAFSTYE